MKSTKTLKTVAATLALGIAALGCAVFSGCSSASTMEKFYTYASYYNMVTTSTNWYVAYQYNIETYNDGSYVYTYTEEWFGQADSQNGEGDLECKGRSVIKAWGEYTSSVSSIADYYLDLDLSAATRVAISRSGKLYGYVAASRDSWSGYVDTANWDASETQTLIASLTDAGFEGIDTVEGFLSHYAPGWTVTVTDPSLEPENTNLTYVMNAAPKAKS